MGGGESSQNGTPRKKWEVAAKKQAALETATRTPIAVPLEAAAICSDAYLTAEHASIPLEEVVSLAMHQGYLMLLLRPIFKGLHQSLAELVHLASDALAGWEPERAAQRASKTLLLSTKSRRCRGSTGCTHTGCRAPRLATANPLRITNRLRVAG